MPICVQWQIISQKVQFFRTRRCNEYLSSLRPRNKWLGLNHSLQPGDVVIIKDEDTLQGHWPMDKVENTFPDKHGTNQVCDSLTAISQYRPAVKFILLLRTKKHKEVKETPIYLKASYLFETNSILYYYLYLLCLFNNNHLYFLDCLLIDTIIDWGGQNVWNFAPTRTRSWWYVRLSQLNDVASLALLRSRPTKADDDFIMMILSLARS